MSKGIIATTLVAAAAASLSVTTSAEALETHQREEQHRQLQWAGVGWGDDDWSSSGKSGKSGGSSSSWGSSSSGKSGKSGGSSSGWSSSGSSSSWDSSSSGKSGKSGSSSWSSSSSSGKSGKSKSSKAHEVWHGGWGKPGWWGQDSSGKSGKSGSSGWSSSSSSGWSSSGKSGKSGSSGSSGWNSSGKSGKSGSSGSSGWSSSGKSGKSGSSSSGWSSSGKSGKSGSSSSGWSSSGKSGKSGSGGGWSSWSSSGKSGKSGSSSSSSGWSSSGKSGKSSKSAKGSKSKGSKSKSSKGGHWSWSDTSSDGWGSSSSSWSSSGKSGKSGSSSGGWYGKNDDDWAGGNKPSKPDYDDWAGLGGGNPSSYKPEPVSAPVHPTGWKDDGWDSDEYYKADIEGIRQECNALITASERELLPKIGRLAFHDCVGGCDGCVNMDNIDNRGLAEPVEGVYPIVQKYSSKLSRADIWAICAIEAVSMAVPGGHNFPLHYIGRKDCADGDEKGYGGENHEMCSSVMSTHEMLTFFSEQFNMNPREVVAIMGIHSASTANRDNSGFGNIGREDGWVEDAEEYILSNKYYHSMKDFAWHLERVENTYPVPTRYQWYFDPEGFGPIMTTSDMAILFNMEGYIQTDKDGVEGLVMCSTSTHPDAEFDIEGVDGEDIPLCPMAEATKEYFDMYYDDNDLFIQDFGPAMNKILNYGYKTWDD